MRTLGLAIVGATVAAIAVFALVCRDGAEGPAPPASRARTRIAELRRQPPGAIAGTVTARGEPVARAMVCTRLVRDDAAPHCATTDARGAYALDGVPPGAYVAWASATGIGGGRYDGELRVASDRRLAGIDIALAAGAQIRGIVRDVRGTAIGGAFVHVGVDDHPAFTTQTAGDGAFVAWARPGDIHVEVEAEHYVDGEARGIAPTDALAIELVPESVVAGIVVEAGTRRPLDDALVDVAGHTARTDATGRFRIGKLRPGRYKPTATSIGGYGETAESVLVELGRTVGGLVIEVHPVAVVVGRIVADDGTPCPPDRGEVWLDRYGSRAIYIARTTDGGDVLLEGVVPGTYEVRAACRGWLSQVPYPDLVVGSSDVDDVVWRVSPGARIAGRVIGRDGAPLAGAIVNHHAASGGSLGSVATGPDGRFTADGVAPGVNAIVASADGHVHGDEQTVVAALDTVAAVELVLDLGGSLEGDVVDDTGAPVTALVSARGPSGGSEWSDARGHFAIHALAPGAYEVRVETDWSPAPPARATAATVTTGGTAHVRVVAERDTGDITGIVVDHTGAPVTDAYITAAREDDAPGDEPTSRTRGAWHTPGVLAALDGSFHLTGLPRGRFSLRAARDGAGFAVVEHVARGEHARLTIRPTGVLAGVVTGAHVEDVTVSAIDRVRDVSREERLYHTGGRFALRDLPAGTYRIAVDDDPRSVITVALADGERREDLRLVAQPRFTLRGRLVTGGRPVRGWTVEVPRLERDETSNGRTIVVSSIETAITGADGRFLLRNLPAGPIELSAGDLSRDPDAKLAVVRQLVLQGATDVELGDIEAPR